MQRESHGVLRHLMMNLTLNSPTCPIQCTSSKYKVLRSTQAHTHSAVCLRHLVLTLFTNSFVAVWVHMHLFLVETTFFKTYSESIKTVWVFLLLLFLGISVDWGIQADEFFFFKCMPNLQIPPGLQVLLRYGHQSWSRSIDRTKFAAIADAHSRSHQRAQESLKY